MNTETMKTVTQYDEFQAQIDEAKEICNFIPDVSTKEGYDKSKRVALDVGKVRTALEKSRKAKKSDSIAIGKAIDADAKSIDAQLDEMQAPHKLAYKDLDNAKKEREQARKDEIEVRVARLRELPEILRESDSDSIAAALESVNAEECLDFFEYSAEALKARNASRTALSKMFQDALQAESDAAELAELRKSQAEQAIKDREQAAAENARKEAERVAADNAAKIEADKQAAINAQEAAEAATKQAETNRIAEAAQAKQDAIEAAELAEKQKKAAVQAEIDRQAATAEAEKVATAKREAGRANTGKIRKAAKEGLMTIDGMNEALAKKVVAAISNGAIANVKINY